MSVDLIIREQLPINTVVLDGSSFDNSIIGITFDGRAIYSRNRMIEEYMYDNKCSEEDALDWIEYNTIPSVPYMPTPRPLIVEELT